MEEEEHTALRQLFQTIEPYIKGSKKPKFSIAAKQLSASTKVTYKGFKKVPEWFWNVLNVRDQLITIYLNASENETITMAELKETIETLKQQTLPECGP
jgi:hypothetical protein